MTVSPAAAASLIVAYSDLRVVQLVRGAIAPPTGADGGRLPPLREHPEPRFEPRPVVRPTPRFEVRPTVEPRPADAPAAAQPPELPAEPLLPPRFGPLPPPWRMPTESAAPVPTCDCVKPSPRLVEVNDSGRLLDQFV